MMQLPGETMKYLNSIVAEWIAPLNAANLDSRAIITRYMDARAARRALHMLRMHRVLVKAEIAFLRTIEALWAKQGLRLCRTLEVLFPVGGRPKSERHALKQIAFGLKLVQLRQFFTQGTLYLHQLDIALRDRDCDLLKLNMLVLKIRHLIPQGFNGTIDDLFLIGFEGGYDIAQTLDHFRNGLEYRHGLFGQGKDTRHVHVLPPACDVSIDTAGAEENGARP